MTDLRIRPAGPEDLDAVLAFWKTAAEGTSISDDREGVERLVACDPEALLLAERDGELVGTVIAGFDGWRCHSTGWRCTRTTGAGASGRPCSPPPTSGSSGSAGAAGTRWCWCATSGPSMPGGPPGTSRRSSGGAG
ncbi:hypothetical protein STENM327S_03550 [Streptomyces tendae]